MDQPCCILRDGTCNLCKAEVDDNEMIRCYHCKNNFHALCGHSGDKICNKSLLVLFLQKSTKRNFVWYCDSCITRTELTSTDTQTYYNQKVDDLAGKIDQLSAQVNSIADVISTPNQNAAPLLETNGLMNSGENFSSSNAWGNVSKVTIMKNNLGSPADLNELEKRVVDNHIQITHSKRNNNGDVVITCPNSSAANKVKNIAQQLLPDHTIKDPQVNYSWINVVGFETNHSINDAHALLVKNNAVFDCIKNKTLDEAKEFMEVKAVKPCFKNPTVHRALLKVSKSLRRLIKLGKDKLRIGLFSCTVYDQSPQIKRCNRCQKFGHWVANCDVANGKACAKCSSIDHETQSCNIDRNDLDKVKCINCIREGIVSLHPSHTADSSTCPCFINHKNHALTILKTPQTGNNQYQRTAVSHQQSGNFQTMVPVPGSQSFHPAATLHNYNFPMNQQGFSNVYGITNQFGPNNSIPSMSGTPLLSHVSHSSQGHLNC